MVKFFQAAGVSAAMVALSAGLIWLLVPSFSPQTRWMGWALALLPLLGAIALACTLPLLYREAAGVRNDAFVPVPMTGAAQNTTPGVAALASALRDRLVDTPYQVLVSPTSARVEWNLGDVRYRSMLVEHRVQRIFRTTLTDVGGGRFRRVDQEQSYDASLGRLHTASASGRLVRIERRVDLAIGPEGVTATPVDYTLDSRIIDRAVQAGLAQVGGRTALSAEKVVAIVGGVFGAITALAAVLVAFVS